MKAYTSYPWCTTVNPNLEEILSIITRLEETVLRWKSYQKAIGKRVWLAIKAIVEFVKQKIAELTRTQEQINVTFNSIAELVDTLECEYPDMYNADEIVITVAYNNGRSGQVCAILYTHTLRKFDRRALMHIIAVLDASESPDRVLRSIKDRLRREGYTNAKYTAEIMRVLQGRVK